MTQAIEDSDLEFVAKSLPTGRQAHLTHKACREARLAT